MYQKMMDTSMIIRGSNLTPKYIQNPTIESNLSTLEIHSSSCNKTTNMVDIGTQKYLQPSNHHMLTSLVSLATLEESFN